MTSKLAAFVARLPPGLRPTLGAVDAVEEAFELMQGSTRFAANLRRHAQRQGLAGIGRARGRVGMGDLTSDATGDVSAVTGLVSAANSGDTGAILGAGIKAVGAGIQTASDASKAAGGGGSTQGPVFLSVGVGSSIPLSYAQAHVGQKDVLYYLPADASRKTSRGATWKASGVTWVARGGGFGITPDTYSPDMKGATWHANLRKPGAKKPAAGTPAAASTTKSSLPLLAGAAGAILLAKNFL